MLIAVSLLVLGHPGRDRHQATAQQLVVDLQLLIAGVTPDSSGTTHICTKCTGSLWVCSPVRVHESFFSECRMPRPARHPLGQARVDHPGVAGGVLVNQ